MCAKLYWVAFITLLRKEIKRFLRVWVQTLLPPLVTMTLYFLIFGGLIGQRLGSIEGFSYMQYIAPGLIMMSVITAAYTNVVTSFFGMLMTTGLSTAFAVSSACSFISSG